MAAWFTRAAWEPAIARRRFRSSTHKLVRVETGESPFADLTSRDTGRDVHWIAPQLVVEVEYAGWTQDGRLRFPAFRGVRDDLDASSVVVQDREGTTASTDPPELEAVLSAQLANVRLTNPERIMYPDDGVTKLGLATYLLQVADHILPHLLNRPLALLRCPQGCQQTCFFQKKPMAGMPPEVEMHQLSRPGGSPQPAIVIRNLPGLLALVQFSALELHTWGCRADRPDRPDSLTFDLDPDTALPFARVCEAALLVRDQLSTLGLTSFVKTSGGKGLHIVVPIRRRSAWATASQFCDAVGHQLASQSPTRFTVSASKTSRQGKIYIDTLRNRFGATTIAAYSTRARNGAAISMPLGWEELATLRAANGFTVKNAPARLSHLAHDPWQGYFETSQSLTKSLLRQVL